MDRQWCPRERPVWKTPELWGLSNGSFPGTVYSLCKFHKDFSAPFVNFLLQPKLGNETFLKRKNNNLDRRIVGNIRFSVQISKLSLPKIGSYLQTIDEILSISDFLCIWVYVFGYQVVLSSIHSMYIFFVDSKHLYFVACFAKLVLNGLWAVRAEQQETYSRLLSVPARKESNVYI